MVQTGMATTLARGLSLWLIPEIKAAEHFSSWIARLATRHQTEGFPPHLTLLSALPHGPQALNLAGRLASGIAPFPVTPEDIQAREEHFRCLFVRVRNDPALLAVHATAAHAFGRAPQPGFLPHVSLVYGALAPDERLAIAREVGDDLRSPFEVRRLQLWRTEGPVSEWRELAAFDLRRSFGSP